MKMSVNGVSRDFGSDIISKGRTGSWPKRDLNPGPYAVI